MDKAFLLIGIDKAHCVWYLQNCVDWRAAFKIQHKVRHWFQVVLCLQYRLLQNRILYRIVNQSLFSLSHIISLKSFTISPARQPNRSIFWIVFVPTFWWKLLIKLICSQSKPFMIFYRYCWLLLGRSIINWAFKALVYASFNFIAQHNFVYCFKSINGVFSCRFLDSSNAALPLSDVAFENFYKLISD